MASERVMHMCRECIMNDKLIEAIENVLEWIDRAPPSCEWLHHNIYLNKLRDEYNWWSALLPGDEGEQYESYTDYLAAVELARLEIEFDACGGRSIELAERIDELRAR